MTCLTRRILVLGLTGLLAPAGHSQAPLPAPVQSVILSITGAISVRNQGDGALFDAAMLDALPAHSFRTSTPWFKKPVTFSGPRLQDVLDAVGASGNRLHLVALNDYAVRIPMDDARRFRPLLARRIDGKVIGVRDKGPLFLVYPYDDEPETRTELYYARSIWQLTRITVE